MFLKCKRTIFQKDRGHVGRKKRNIAPKRRRRGSQLRAPEETCEMPLRFGFLRGLRKWQQHERRDQQVGALWLRKRLAEPHSPVQNHQGCAERNCWTFPQDAFWNNTFCKYPEKHKNELRVVWKVNLGTWAGRPLVNLHNCSFLAPRTLQPLGLFGILICFR